MEVILYLISVKISLVGKAKHQPHVSSTVRVALSQLVALRRVLWNIAKMSQLLHIRECN